MSEIAARWIYCLVQPCFDASQKTLTARAIRFDEDINQLANYEFQRFRSVPEKKVPILTALFWATIGSLGQDGWELVHYHSAVQSAHDFDNEGNEVFSVSLEAILKKMEIDQVKHDQ